MEEHENGFKVEIFFALFLFTKGQPHHRMTGFRVHEKLNIV